MRTKVLLGAAVVLMLIVSVATIGSNMGFKISVELTAAQTNFISIPYYNSYQMASQLWADAGGAAQGIIVIKWNKATSRWQYYTDASSPDFPLDPGESVNIQTNTTHNFIMVGSHNPALQVSILPSNTNFVSVPYHTTDATASALWTELGGAANGIIIIGWDKATNRWQYYTDASSPDFPIVPGTGYNIQTSNTLNWVPSHY